MSEIKRGRPRKDEERDKLTFIGFKADSETMAAIEKLEAEVAVEPGVVEARSIAIRRALIESAKSTAFDRDMNERMKSPDFAKEYHKSAIEISRFDAAEAVARAAEAALEKWEGSICITNPPCGYCFACDLNNAVKKWRSIARDCS